MRGILDSIDQEIFQDLTFLLMQTVLMEANIKDFTGMAFSQELSEVRKKILHQGNFTIQKSINRIGQNSAEYHIIYDINQLNLIFFDNLRSSENFYRLFNIGRHLSFRELGISAQTLFNTFDEFYIFQNKIGFIPSNNNYIIVENIWKNLISYILQLIYTNVYYSGYHAFHYTSANNILNMITSGQICFTEVNKLNDAEEFSRNEKSIFQYAENNMKFMPDSGFLPILFDNFRNFSNDETSA